jgi:hypothetical protein
VKAYLKLCSGRKEPLCIYFHGHDHFSHSLTLVGSCSSKSLVTWKGNFFANCLTMSNFVGCVLYFPERNWQSIRKHEETMSFFFIGPSEGIWSLLRRPVEIRGIEFHFILCWGLQISCSAVQSHALLLWLKLVMRFSKDQT